jgi:hypothetical protein
VPPVSISSPSGRSGFVLGARLAKAHQRQPWARLHLARPPVSRSLFCWHLTAALDWKAPRIPLPLEAIDPAVVRSGLSLGLPFVPGEWVIPFAQVLWQWWQVWMVAAPRPLLRLTLLGNACLPPREKFLSVIRVEQPPELCWRATRMIDRPERIESSFVLPPRLAISLSIFVVMAATDFQSW